MNRQQRRHPASGFGRHLSQAPQTASVDVSYGWHVAEGTVMLKFSRPCNFLNMTPPQAEELIKSVGECLQNLASAQAAKEPNG